MKQKVLYYSDELNDELAPATIQSRVIDEKFKYKKGLIWNVCSLFIQNVLSMPIKWGYLRIKFRHKFVGKEKLKECKNQGYFMYANHTQPFADTFIPSVADYPKRNFLIVNPVNISLRGTGTLVEMLGAIPIPSDIKAMKNFLATIEEKIKNKELYLPPEELERKMYWEVKKQLEKAGYVHYEISNFAKPGYESKHNLSCWNQEEYLGFGIAAHSYFNGERYSNTEDFDKYFEHPEDSKIIHEKQTQEDRQREFMLLGLRKIDGVKISDFKNKFIENPIYLYRESLNKLVTQGLIEIDIDSIKLTNRGIDLANLVWEEFV